MVPGRPDEGDEVGLDLVGDADRSGPRSRRARSRGAVDHRLDRVERLGAGLMAAGDRPLGRLIGIAEPGPQEEPVQLGLGQGERALELDRVLGREDDERVGQRPGLALDRDLALLHRLEQRGLRPRRGAVDLVDEQDVREHGARREAEAAALVQARAGDVDREEVGRALDAVRVERRGLARPRGRAASCRCPGHPRRGRGRRRGAPSAMWRRGSSAPTTARPTAACRSSQRRREARSAAVRRPLRLARSRYPWRGPRVASLSTSGYAAEVRGRSAESTSTGMDGAAAQRQASAASRRRTAGRIPPCW